MLIPIGHEEHTVRRLPWVTFAIIALNLLLFLTVGLSGQRAEQRAAERLQEVFEFWQAHPYLELPQAFMDQVPSRREREQLTVLNEAMKNIGGRPDESEQVAREQAHLDALALRFEEARAENPLHEWAFVPSEPAAWALVASMFMHAGWLHLLTNMFVFFLAAPAIEDKFGRPVFLVLYLASGLAAVGAHVLAHPGSDTPLIGASGAIAGIMGAFLVRLARTKIRFFYWFFLFFRGTFDAPAWLMLSLWGLQQAFYGSLTGEAQGVAYWAHAGGFAFGAVVALALRGLRIEERFINPGIEAKISITQHPGLGEGLDHLARGDVARARAALERAAAEDPRNPDVQLALWQCAVADGKPAAGIANAAAAIDAELRKGEPELALAHWRELRRVAGSGGPASLRWRLAAAFADGPEDAADVLADLARDPSAEMLAEKAARRLDALGIAAPPPPPPPEPEVPPLVEDLLAPRHKADQPPDPHVVIEPCVPDRIEEEGLFLHGETGGVELVPFSDAAGIALAGVAGETRPVLVVDILLQPEPGERRRAMRMVSSGFDPRRVVGRHDLAPLAAVRLFVETIVARSGCAVLVGGELLRGERLPMFDSLEAYERAVFPGGLAPDLAAQPAGGAPTG